MIKLNNKNITYVALADTNNSIKAPKEIWYADSNNSVKLVYRRKDALIEGEDYEKYHWLEGDGNAYIDTLVTSYSGVIKVGFKSTESINCAIFGREASKSDFTDRLVLLRYYNNGYNVSDLYGIKTSGGYWIPTDLNDEEITIDLDNQIMTNKSGTYSIQINVGVNVTGFSVILFGRRYNESMVSAIAPSDVAIKKFSVSNQINFIPCKLLKPVPKWLDANGIRRQVGECGMIDLVSGKFYGNVNSVGTFTVENYYERKEWLVGDGSAYIDTLTALSDSDTVEMKITGGTIPSASQAYKLIFGNNTNSYNYNAWVLFVGSLIAIRPTKTSSADEYRFQISTSQELTISQSTTSVTVNGTEVWSGTSAYTEIADKCTLFAAGTNVSHCYDGKVAYLRISNKLNLIPCTLTMDLPASMDANNTPRTKGTSGMWDLVSDRFYGNVASSGTFKAVNLAEGVDYEVHQWLVGDGSAYIDTLVNSLTNSLGISCTYKIIDSVSDNRIFGREGYANYGAARCVARHFNNQLNIWGYGASNEISFQSPNNIIHNLFIDLDLRTAYLNDVSSSFYCTRDKEYNFFVFAGNASGVPSGRVAGVSFSKFEIIGLVHLTPCRLLHSIPSKYDANGIARQAGECGMYDTINDVFYGNVASSGSFTVSDDN